MTLRERALFQMNTPRLCMPFDVFHEAVEHALGRPVFTHEFGLNYKGLLAEMNGEKVAPTFEEICALIPAEKRLLVISPEKCPAWTAEKSAEFSKKFEKAGQ